MKKQSSLSLVLICSFLIPAAAQNQIPRPAQPSGPQQAQKDDDDVVRITTNLVQVDAVVTGKDGKLVTDLKPEEFEIYEDGRQQKITNFSFVLAEPEAPPLVAAKTSAAPVDKRAPLPPPVRLRPEQVRRTIAVVVDDLGLSFESTAYVRQALKKFVDRQVQPGDLVAIIRTGGGIGALQQFTSDKQQLTAAVEHVKWNPQGRSGVGAFARVDADSVIEDQDAVGSTTSGSADLNKANEDLIRFREELFSVGTLGALNYVVRGMRQLPGRKSILLLSDGIKILNPDDQTQSTRVLDALHHLTDLANRASVVIYTMDARGLVNTEMTAADNVAGLSTRQLETNFSDDPSEAPVPNRSAELFESQNGLNYLAQQ
ncbi:MAG TPA: VWA domain-containing protein, partial [Pyrinomonadaceae bacterium]|nr:VWA domain-containing protein [Pyrinomonadaceae bacterium]